MRRLTLAIVCVSAAAGCNKQAADGLPPATEWQADPGTVPSSQPEGAPPAMMAPRRGPSMGGRSGMSNPHAGLNMGGDGDPHAGLDMGGGDGDPHAGLNLGDMSDPSNPHAGLDMSQNPHAGGTDVTKLGLSAPDPDRAIDPTRRVAGLLTVDAKAKDRLKAGTSVFLIVKRAGPDGAPTGSPLAVDKLTWTGGAGVAFELTDAQAMIAGTQLAGDVVVMARYDQDSDALTKEPGDVTGQLRVKIPADNVKLVLDTVLP
jgi:hypothetical protein